MVQVFVVAPAVAVKVFAPEFSALERTETETPVALVTAVPFRAKVAAQLVAVESPTLKEVEVVATAETFTVEVVSGEDVVISQVGVPVVGVLRKSNWLPPLSQAERSEAKRKEHVTESTGA